eukprot:scaffold79433_cov27-Phaeocystis_antarctica.AAC.1
MPAAHTLACPEPATPPCRGAHQTGLPHSRGEFDAYALLRGASARLGPLVDHPHDLRGPIRA